MIDYNSSLRFVLKWVGVLGLFISSMQISYGQQADFSGDTIRWNATGFTDEIANVGVDASCQFVTFKGNTVDWVQGEGSYVVSFTVTATNGVWSDLSVNGSVVLTVTSGVVTGQITFSRTTQGLSAELSLTGGTGDIHNTYSINSYLKL